MAKHRPAAATGAMMLAFALSACGGGGGVNSTPAPPPSGTPITTPDPPTDPAPAAPQSPVVPSVNYDDFEYRRSDAAFAANALAAYSAGATGMGAKIAVLDSGLSDPLNQFTGRIDPASRDMVANRGIGDPDGHGTSVAAVAAAGRDGESILGVAFNATLLALRSDAVGTCGASDGCKFDDSVLARGVDHAVQNGARVINMSLGGSPSGSALTAAIDRATAAGVIVVISAGNDSAAEPDPFAHVANSPSARGLVVIAGAHDANDAIADFSNRAGGYGQYYLTARGARVLSFDQTGAHFLFSGTSYAAPAIAGAAALLAQAFPNLSGAQIVDLLMRTAFDAGAPGTDAVYGRGLLDLTRAFQPQGATSLAGSQEAVSLGSNGTLGPAMGDAGAQGTASLGAVILDGYSRAYALDLARTIGIAARAKPLARAIGGDVRRATQDAGGLAVSVSIRRDPAGQPWAGLAQLGLTRDDARRAHALGGRIAARIDRHTAAAFGYSEGGRALADMLADEEEAPFLIARRPGETPGFEARRRWAMALRHDLGRMAVTVSGERGTLLSGRLRGETEAGYHLASIDLEYAVGPARIAAGLGLLREEDSALGGRFGPALGGGGATTRLLDLDARLAIDEGWYAGASWRLGWTKADVGGALADGRLRSTAFAVDLGRVRALDRFGVRIAQPLRVATGGYGLRLPTSYDYASGAVGYELRRLDLSPKGREIDTELAYGRRLGAAWFDANLFWRRDPGNIAAAPNDLGAAVRFSMGF